VIEVWVIHLFWLASVPSVVLQALKLICYSTCWHSGSRIGKIRLRASVKRKK
jgi:hypothetical protein